VLPVLVNNVYVACDTGHRKVEKTIEEIRETALEAIASAPDRESIGDYGSHGLMQRPE
jgi:hypothetical protein